MAERRVVTKVSLSYSPKDVEHIIRCWVNHTESAVVSGTVPRPEHFSDVHVNIYADDDGKITGADVTYEIVEKPMDKMDPGDIGYQY